VTLWQTVIYFVYKLLLNYRSFKAIAGCPLDSSSSRTARQHTARSAQNWLWANCPDFITKTNGLKIRRIQGIALGYLGQPITRTDRQDGERLLKLSDWRLVLDLGAVGGHFEHSQWQWKSDIWSLVNCVVWLVSAMLLNWCCSLNISNRWKIGKR